MTHKSSHIIIDALVQQNSDTANCVNSMSPDQLKAALENMQVQLEELQKIIEKER